MPRIASSTFPPDLPDSLKLCYREPPADPGPDAPACSWCRHDSSSTRIPFLDQDADAPAADLCDTCMLLVGFEDASRYLAGGAFWASWPIVTGLATEPHHESGCAFCGRAATEARAWWPDPYVQDHTSVLLKLCDICPGLLELADTPDRELLWRRRLRTACRVGMQDRLGQEADLPELPQPERKPKPKTKRATPLTDAHREMLETIRQRGAMDSHAFSRDDQHRVRRRPLSWWGRRIAHLFDHHLITTVTNPPGTHAINTVRILEQDERELEDHVYTWHVPGPVWDGERVFEASPPDGWSEQHARLMRLRAERDKRALELRAAAEKGATGEAAEVDIDRTAR